MKNEVWKDIPGYEGLYIVSSLGRIKSLYNYRKYNILGNYITEYESISEAGRKNNVSPSNICKCIKGIYKQVNGYVYSYKRGW